MWLTKPFLMPSLIVLLMVNGQRNWSIERICSIMALISSCLGDILLLKHRQHLFLLALVTFLMAHINYIILFLGQIRYQRGGSTRYNRISAILVASIPFLAYAAFILYILYPHLTVTSAKKSSLLLPVVIYALIIVAMAYVSFLRSPKGSGYWFAFVGALIFILSDTMIAYDQFIQPLSVRGLPVMATYGTAQYLITVGTLKVGSKTSKNI